MLVVVSISTRFDPTNNHQSFNIYHFINVKNPFLNFNLYTLQLNLESF